MQPSEQIKLNLDIVVLIGEYIQLQSAGSNFRAVCPFHKEKSPSFMVSQEKQIWHCFGCGEGGDVFSFVMKMEGLSFVEVLRILAPKAGVELKRQDPKLASERNRLLDILDISSRYYHQVLLKNNQAKLARDYLKKRGLSQTTIDIWRIGYSLDSWDDLISFLKKKGFSDNDILSSGMSIKKDRGYGFYNRFRGRIMFPISDINSNVVAFTARVSPEKEYIEKMGKYINSPQTIIYDKSKIIFGLDKAKLNIKKEDLSVVVEGQMDVITAHQNNFINTIASSGTALTQDQLNIIKRYSNNISLAFDADQAGQMAADRGIASAMELEMNIKIIQIPLGKDPDDCIRNNPEIWLNSINQAKEAMEYYFLESVHSVDLSDVVNKRKVVQKLLPRIVKLSNKIEQDFWIKKLSQTISVEENILRETLLKFVKSKNNVKNFNNKQILSQNKNSNLDRSEKLSHSLIALILKFSFLIELMVKKLSSTKIVGQNARDLYSKLLIYYTSNNNEFNYDDFYSFLNKNNSNKDVLDLLNVLIISGDRDLVSYDEISAKNEALEYIKFLEENYKYNKSRELERLIREAEKNNNKNEIDNLMIELQECKKVNII